MRKFLWLPVVLALLWLGVLAGPTTAHADDDAPSSWQITKYDLDADASANGDLKVDLTIDFDFATDEGHGPFVTLPDRQAISDDPDHWRVIRYSEINVTSPSGAPAEVEVDHDNGHTVLKIGDSDVDVQGLQTYQISYLAKGVVNPAGADHPDTDEISWNAVGPDWQVPISNVDVTVTAPVNTLRTACFTGKKFADPCTGSSAAGNTATFEDNQVSDGEGVQVVAAYPAGTFPGAQLEKSHRASFANLFALNPAAGAVGVVGLLGSLGIGRWLRRRGRDEYYAGVSPGQVPRKGEQQSVTNEPVRQFAVQFQPPAGVSPGEGGTLLDNSADSADITATIVDLAVRRHLKITEGGDGWQIDLLDYPEKRLPHEQVLLDKMFDTGLSTTMAELEAAHFGDAVNESKEKLYEQVTTTNRWYRGNPAYGAAPGIAIGVGFVALAFVAATVGSLNSPGWGLAVIGLLLAAVVAFVAARHGIGRTPDGSAVHAQVKGFEKYLTTAEADQIKFEEGVDIFSRYLPWAIAFGVAERWAKVFEDLAARGVDVPEPYWFVGTNPVGFSSSAASFTESLAGFESATSSAATSTSSSSGGGSGFSGGGGVGGGGGGGW